MYPSLTIITNLNVICFSNLINEKCNHEINKAHVVCLEKKCMNCDTLQMGKKRPIILNELDNFIPTT